MIKIFIADDHPTMLNAMEGIIEIVSDDLDEEIMIIGKAKNGNEAFSQIMKLKPDVALLDINMPGMNGISVAQKCIQSKSQTKFIMFTGFVDENIASAKNVGVQGFLSKTADPAEVAKAIKIVADDGEYVGKGLRDKWKSFIPATPLSKREREVFLVSLSGLTSEEAAKKLGITPHTVDVHLSSVYEKLEAKNKADAMRIALKKGIISMDEIED